MFVIDLQEVVQNFEIPEELFREKVFAEKQQIKK